MSHLPDLVESLLDDDGSCRDLNFESPTWPGVEALLAAFEVTCGAASGCDQQGESLDGPLAEAAVAAARGGRHVSLDFGDCSGPIKNLQAFVCAEKNGAPFVEITFFPTDVVRSETLRSDFIAWAAKLQSLLEARRIYARYENVSWRLGDTQPGAGVFWVGEEAVPHA
jgi:hypothetical protein